MDSLSDYEYVALISRQNNKKVENLSNLCLPISISCHAGVYHKNRFYLIGGLNWQEENIIFYEFNFDTLEWDRIIWNETSVPRNCLLNRIGHTANIYSLNSNCFNEIFFDCNSSSVRDKNCILMFGGVVANCYDNTLWFYSLELKIWKDYKLKFDEHCPSPRAGHSAVIWKNYLIIHGGYKLFEIYNDTFLFDLESLKWSTIEAPEDTVYTRSWHIAAIWKDYMYVHSGCNVNGDFDPLMRLNLNTHSWEEQYEHGIVPAPRSRHAGVVINDRWLIQGGRSYDKKTYCDFFEFNFESGTWLPIYIKEGHLQNRSISASTAVNSNSLSKYSRCCHCMALNEDKQCIILVGGAHTFLRDSRDVYIFKYYPRCLKLLMEESPRKENKVKHCKNVIKFLFEQIKEKERGIIIKISEYI